VKVSLVKVIEDLPFIAMNQQQSANSTTTTSAINDINSAPSTSVTTPSSTPIISQFGGTCTITFNIGSLIVSFSCFLLLFAWR